MTKRETTATTRPIAVLKLEKPPMADQTGKFPKVFQTDVRAASLAQIHAAIDCLRRGDFVSAIALGSAAEGILPGTENPHLFTKLEKWQKSLPPDIGGATGLNDFNNWV